MPMRKVLLLATLLATPAIAHAQSILHLQCQPQTQNGYQMLPGFTPSAVTVASHVMFAGSNGDIVWDGRIGHALIASHFVSTTDLPNYAGAPWRMTIDLSNGFYVGTDGVNGQTGVCVRAPS